MAALRPQTYANHARYIPGFHFVAAGIFGANLIYALIQLIDLPGLPTTMTFLVAVGLVLLFFYARSFAMRVQDRVICLEERLRHQRLLPADLQRRVEDFSHNQLIALRFASDAELPTLARKVLDQGVKSRTEIKQMVSVWRPDDLRA